MRRSLAAMRILFLFVAVAGCCFCPAPSYAFESFAVVRARSYVGTNPTGWDRLWCARFMAMLFPNAAAKLKNPNSARDWAALPKTKPCQPGSIAVLTRGKYGGHNGVVAGCDRNGNPTVISGNHNRVVGEGVYPRSRVIAWVMP